MVVLFLGFFKLCDVNYDATEFVKGRMIAAGTEDGSVSILEVENGQIIHTLKPHSNCVTSLFWTQEYDATSAAGSVFSTGTTIQVGFTNVLVLKFLMQ